MIHISGDLKILKDFIVSKAGPRLLELRIGASKRDWKAQTDFRTAPMFRLQRHVKMRYLGF